MIRGTREWAVAEINCCVGCPHGCRYCYARRGAVQKGTVQSDKDWQQCRIITGEVTRQQSCYPGQVMFPAAHDIVPENLTACIRVIDSLLTKGNRVLIVSKPTVACIKTLCDTFYEKCDQLLFRFTITARDREILAFWEPAAPSYQERRESLALAYGRGFATSVSIEPMLDVRDVTFLVEEIGEYVTHSIWIGKMNNIDERVAPDSIEMRKEVARIKKEQGDRQIRRLYRELQDNPLIRWKESIKLVIGLPLAEQAGLDL